MLRPLIYVAGPYGSTSETLEGRKRNVELADQVGREIAFMGGAPFIPHKNTFGWERAFDASHLSTRLAVPKRIIFECDFAVLHACKALVWVKEVTTGVAAEMAYSAILDKPIFAWPDERRQLESWLNAWKYRA